MDFTPCFARGMSPLCLAAAATITLAIPADSARAQAEGEGGGATLPEVTVTGEGAPAEGSAAAGYRAVTGTVGPLGKLPLQDTPYSLNVTPGALIENTNAHSLGDALHTNPTATLLMSSGGYSSMARMMVRGFTAADQSELRDGLVDRSFSYPPIENVERIEVMNGFSGFLYGFSALGGTVNYVSKDPTPELLASVASGIYGGGIGFVHADLGGPVPATDGRLGFRFNAYHESGETTIDGSDQDRTLVSMRLTYALTPGTRLWADAWHQDYHAKGLQTYFALGSGVAVPDAKNFDPGKQYGQDWTFNDADKTLAGAGFDSELNEVFTVRGGYRYGTMSRGYDYIGATLTNNSGTYSEKYTETPRQHEETHAEYALLDARLRTGPVGHTVTVGYSGTDYTYDRGADISYVFPGLSSIAAPAVFADPGGRLPLGATNQWQSQDYNNVLAGDRLALSEQVSALLGVTYASLKQRAWGPGAVISTSNFVRDAVTPTYALMYKPIPALTAYASYMEALVGGDSAPSTAVNAYQVLDPSVSEQYEIGVKATLGRMELSAALFRIDKVNAELDPRDNVFKADGREIHQGVEVVGSGKLTDRLTAVGGFTLMDAHIDKATANPATEGKIPVNVPESQARLYLEYALPFLRDLTVTAGANYYGRRPVDVTNTQFLSDAVTVDAGLRYEPEIYGHPISAALTIANLADTAYWAYFRSGDGLLLGQPRTVSFTLRAKW